MWMQVAVGQYRKEVTAVWRARTVAVGTEGRG